MHHVSVIACFGVLTAAVACILDGGCLHISSRTDSNAVHKNLCCTRVVLLHAVRKAPCLLVTTTNDNFRGSVSVKMHEAERNFYFYIIYTGIVCSTWNIRDDIRTKSGVYSAYYLLPFIVFYRFLNGKSQIMLQQPCSCNIICNDAVFHFDGRQI